MHLRFLQKAVLWMATLKRDYKGDMLCLDQYTKSYFMQYLQR